MLAGAGIDRQHEHEPGRAPRPVGRGRGRACEFHADAVGWVYALIGFLMRGRPLFRSPLSINSNNADAGTPISPAVLNPAMMKGSRRAFENNPARTGELRKTDCLAGDCCRSRRPVRTASCPEAPRFPSCRSRTPLRG